MTEALLDNALQREFVGHFRAARFSFCCASHGNLCDSHRQPAQRIFVEQSAAAHNHCVRLDWHDHTGEDHGDKHSATR